MIKILSVGWPFGNLGIGIGIGISASASALASASAFKYKHCLLHNINKSSFELKVIVISPIQQLAMCSLMSHDNI